MKGAAGPWRRPLLLLLAMPDRRAPRFKQWTKRETKHKQTT
jgi:hypothetical protein